MSASLVFASQELVTSIACVPNCPRTIEKNDIKTGSKRVVSLEQRSLPFPHQALLRMIEHSFVTGNRRVLIGL